MKTKKSFNSLRREINSNFLIRVEFGPSSSVRSRLCSLGTLCEIFDYLHAEHFAEKALKSPCVNPTFRCKGATIVFVCR